jgi:hypothetical protein
MPHRLVVLAKEAGFRGLFAGLGPRMIMTAGLVSSQFLMYGAIKEGKSYNKPFDDRINQKTSSNGGTARHRDSQRAKDIDLTSKIIYGAQ